MSYKYFNVAYLTPSVIFYFIQREIEQKQRQKQSEELRSFFTTVRAPTIPGSRKKELDTAFFKMIFMDNEPLSAGEREGMRHFVGGAQPGYTPPCYNTVWDTLMPHALEEMEDTVGCETC